MALIPAQISRTRQNPDDSSAADRLAAARTAVDEGRLDEATRILDSLSKTSPAGILRQSQILRGEITVTTSEPAAREQFGKLSDTQIASFIAGEAWTSPLPLTNPSLRSRFVDGLRDLAPKILLERSRSKGLPTPPPKAPPKTEREKNSRASTSRVNPVDSLSGEIVELDRVAETPQSYSMRRITPSGFFYIGTTVKAKNGVTLLPIQMSSHRNLSKGDLVPKEGLVYLIDPQVAEQFDGWLSKNEFEKSIKPANKSRLTFEIRQLKIDAKMRWAAVVVEIQMLLALDFERIAKNDFQRCVGVAWITSSDSQIAYGEGPDWIQRLGGVEYTANVRRKIKDAQRAARTRADATALNAVMANMMNETFVRARKAKDDQDQRQRELMRSLFR